MKAEVQLEMQRGLDGMSLCREERREKNRMRWGKRKVEKIRYTQVRSVS